MIDYLKITNINDFIFCPLSIYFHNLYGNKETMVYQGLKQIDGKKIHESVDNNSYSNRKDIITGLAVYSDVLKIMGKIDIYYASKKELIERKKKVKVIYDGYIFQLYAQYFCMLEMGYEIKKLGIYSYDDNKMYPIKLPEDDLEMHQKFLDTIRTINDFDIATYIQTNSEKCANCIYEPSCDRSLL